MHTFQDATLRPWDLVLNINSARKVWDRLKINLRSYGDLARIESDEATFLLPQVLAVLCEDKALMLWPELRGHDAIVERFGELLDDAKVERQAIAALCEEISDFCQRRGLPASMCETARTIPERIQAREEERGKLLDSPEQQLKAIRTSIAGSPPGRSGVSTSDSSPSDSSPLPSTPGGPPSGNA